MNGRDPEEPEPEPESDLERIRAILDTLAHPTPALTRLVELVQRDPDLKDLVASEEEAKPRRGGRSRGQRVNEARTSPHAAPQRGLGNEGDGSRSAPATVLLPLVVDYANGLMQVEIAAKHGLHVQTVRGRLVEAGVKVRIHNRALSDDELSQARVAIDGGASVRAVARELGVAHTTLLRALKRPGSAL